MLAQETLHERNHTSSENNAYIWPITTLGAFGYFAAYGSLIFISFHLIYPRLGGIGLTSFEAFVLAMTIPLALMLTPPLTAYQQSGGEMTLGAFLSASRFGRIRLSDWGWAFVILLVGGLELEFLAV